MPNDSGPTVTGKAKRARSPDDAMSRLRVAELLLDVSHKVAADRTLDDVLKTFIGLAAGATGAERASLFLNDSLTNELYTRVAQGNLKREIRILNTRGVAGHVFTTGKSVIAQDAHGDEHFDASIDEQTGFVTKSILCVPVKTVAGEIIGVAQSLNKTKGKFTEIELELLEVMATQAAGALQSHQTIERMERSRAQELQFLDVVSDVSSEIHLGALLQKIMGEVSRMLDAERSTLFLNDEKTDELWSEVGGGLGTTQIRIPNHMGIAGTAFTTGKTISIPHAYADLRFNPALDKQTGYFTRSILCVPLVNKNGKSIGVTQVLNKRGGPFTDEDESRLKAFTAQVSISLENAKLFDDVQNMKNYNESILESMSNAVITLDEGGEIVTCNHAGLRLLKVLTADVVGQPAEAFFSGPNAWILDTVKRVRESQQGDLAMDAEMVVDDETLSVNLNVLPLRSVNDETLGSMIMIEDISSEKRMKSTMARYMDPSIAAKLLEGGQELLGGLSSTVTVLFSDVRGFTTLTEELGAQGTVTLLNEYFTIMVDCIQQEGGMLDKFIGDAIMAAFGIPFAHDDDDDRAVRTACAMMSELNTYNRGRVSDGKRPIGIGIGINTDEVVSGNIGSPKRMDYTVIGDGVNLAARLESACKQYGAQILISENTYNNLRGTYRNREVDRVIVKGKTQPVGVYEVLDFHTAETFPNLAEVLGHFREGLAQYRAQRWGDAIATFETALRLNENDFASKMYIERCAQLRETPPGDDWGGIWTMTSK